jgi:hypothetical protein
MSKIHGHALAKASAAGIGALALLFGSLSPAAAMAGYAISGTVPSDNTFYLSSTVRVAYEGNIYVPIDTLPSGNIQWQPYGTNVGYYFAGPVKIADHGTHLIANQVISGTRLQNSFADGHDCWGFCGHDFSGTETY